MDCLRPHSLGRQSLRSQPGSLGSSPTASSPSNPLPQPFWEEPLPSAPEGSVWAAVVSLRGGGGPDGALSIPGLGVLSVQGWRNSGLPKRFLACLLGLVNVVPQGSGAGEGCAQR